MRLLALVFASIATFSTGARAEMVVPECPRAYSQTTLKACAVGQKGCFPVKDPAKARARLNELVLLSHQWDKELGPQFKNKYQPKVHQFLAEIGFPDIYGTKQNIEADPVLGAKVVHDLVAFTYAGNISSVFMKATIKVVARRFIPLIGREGVWLIYAGGNFFIPLLALEFLSGTDPLWVQVGKRLQDDPVKISYQSEADFYGLCSVLHEDRAYEMVSNALKSKYKNAITSALDHLVSQTYCAKMLDDCMKAILKSGQGGYVAGRVCYRNVRSDEDCKKTGKF